MLDRAGFEECNWGAIGEGVCQSGDATIGVYCEEPGLFLGVLGYVDFVDYVWDSRWVSRGSYRMRGGSLTQVLPG